ncbi:MAG: cyclic nucleotide-binding domain-containing protein, partial [Gemmatimonadales bacterium]
MTDATLAAPAPPAVEPEHEPAEVLRRLSQIDILRALPPEEMHALVPHVDFVHLAPGTELMRLGDPGDSMFFIESGTARVERPGQEPVFVGPGSVVGEAALLTGAPRSATVTAETECTVWVIAKHYFDQLLEHSPALKLALEQVMAARRHARPLELPSHH